MLDCPLCHTPPSPPQIHAHLLSYLIASQTPALLLVLYYPQTRDTPIASLLILHTLHLSHTQASAREEHCQREVGRLLEERGVLLLKRQVLLLRQIGGSEKKGVEGRREESVPPPDCDFLLHRYFVGFLFYATYSSNTTPHHSTSGPLCMGLNRVHILCIVSYNVLLRMNFAPLPHLYTLPCQTPPSPQSLHPPCSLSLPRLTLTPQQR